MMELILSARRNVGYSSQGEARTLIVWLVLNADAVIQA